MFCERHDQAPLNKHTNRRHATCEYTRSASHIFSLFRRFGRFLTKPNTQDCVRCRGMGSLAAPFIPSPLERLEGPPSRLAAATEGWKGSGWGFACQRHGVRSRRVLGLRSLSPGGRREACRVKDQVLGERLAVRKPTPKTHKMITKPPRRCQIPRGGFVMLRR